VITRLLGFGSLPAIRGAQGEFVTIVGNDEQEDEQYLEGAEAQAAQLPPHDIDIPEEPEVVRVITRVWEPTLQRYVDRDLGELLLVPTGCDCAEYVSPYDNSVKLKSALPRDLANDVNLYAAMQTNGWVDRHWCMERLELGLNPAEIDKRIADDIPFMLNMKGMPDPTSQVAQTPGLQGDNNGAPLPSEPGPGRGNKYSPGDNLASASTPPNGGPGTGV
jgi:hypothetical protein